jgi:aminotransferase
VITDEIYEHIVYPGASHLPIALFPGMRDRTITISGLSKTFSITGWRVGYIIAPPDLTDAIRKIHDFLTVGAAAPLQEAGSLAMRMGKEYYQQLASDYQQRRDYFVKVLQEVGFKVWIPSGAYYVMVDISPLTELDDVTFVDQLIRDYGVAAVPGSSFFHRPELGRKFIRFAVCKTLEVLEEAAERLRKLKR